MTPQDKSAPREWWIIVDVEPEGDAEGYAYAHPCLHEHPLEIHVIEHSAYAALQAECERLKAAVEEVEGRRDELIQDLRDHSTWWKQTREERDQWKQMAEEMADLLYEWTNVGAGHAEWPVRVCESLAKFAKLKEQMK